MLAGLELAGIFFETKIGEDMKTIMVMMLVCVMLCVSGCRDKEQAGIAERTIALAEARLEWEKEQYTIAEEYSSIITSLNERETRIRLKNQQLESILTSSEAIIKQRDEQLQEASAIIKQRDIALAKVEASAIIKQRDIALAKVEKCEAIIKKCEAIIKQRDEQLQEASTWQSRNAIPGEKPWIIERK